MVGLAGFGEKFPVGSMVGCYLAHGSLTGGNFQGQAGKIPCTSNAILHYSLDFFTGCGIIMMMNNVSKIRDLATYRNRKAKT